MSKYDLQLPTFWSVH